MYPMLWGFAPVSTQLCSAPIIDLCILCDPVRIGKRTFQPRVVHCDDDRTALHGTGTVTVTAAVVTPVTAEALKFILRTKWIDGQRQRGQGSW
jgi:hypothetical protein